MNDGMITVRSRDDDRRRRRRIGHAVGRWAAWMLFFAVEWLATFLLDAEALRLLARIGLLIAMVSLTVEKLPAWLQEAIRS